MKKSTLIAILAVVLLLAVLLLAACQPKPTTESETPGNQAPDAQVAQPEDMSGNREDENNDNDAEWQDSWGDLN